MNAPSYGITIKHKSPAERGRILAVGYDIESNISLTGSLCDLGFDLLLSESGSQAIDLLEVNPVDMVIIDSSLSDLDSEALIRRIKAKESGFCLPVVLLVSRLDDEMLVSYLDAGVDDFLHDGFTPAELNARITAVEQQCESRNLYKDSIHEQVVAKQILTAALSARNVAVDGVQVLSRSAAIFSGDLVLSARTPDGGLNILLADFTGHGLSAAVGVLPVADMFCVMSEKGFSPEIILRNINSKLYTLLPTDMFMSACMVEIDSSLRSACIWNSGMPDVFILDGAAGRIKQKVKSTHIPLGISKDIDERLKFDDIEIARGDLFVMYTDGLTDAVDPSGEMFGAARLQRIIEGEDNQNAFSAVVREFDRFCRGRVLSDDVTLVTIACGDSLTRPRPDQPTTDIQIDSQSGAGLRVMVEVNGRSLRDIDPVPVILDQYSKLAGSGDGVSHLQRVVTELYDNALNHGVLELSHWIDGSNNDNAVYQQEREKRFERVPYGFVRIELQKIEYHGDDSVLVRLEDSGRGFDHQRLLSRLADMSDEERSRCNSGIALVKYLCQSLDFQGRGNRVEAIVGLAQQSGN